MNSCARPRRKAGRWRRGVSKVSISTLATAISAIAIAANGRSECHCPDLTSSMPGMASRHVSLVKIANSEPNGDHPPGVSSRSGQVHAADRQANSSCSPVPPALTLPRGPRQKVKAIPGRGSVHDWPADTSARPREPDVPAWRGVSFKVVPPQMPSWVVFTPKDRHAARTVQRGQTPLAALISPAQDRWPRWGRKLRILTPAGPRDIQSIEPMASSDGTTTTSV